MNMAEGNRVNGKVAIITGGSRGIGKDCAREFARQGAKVVICSNEDAEGKETEKELKQECTKSEVNFVYCDVTNDESVKNVVKITVEKYGKVDCLLNIAGLHPPHQPIDDVSSEDFNRLLDLNTTGYFRFCKFTLPHLRKVQGSIVNISSMTADCGQMHAAAYSASKGAILSMTKALAIDEAVNRVRINCICPGAIQTPLLQKMFDMDEDPVKSREACKKASILRTIGQGKDIGMACLYLVADAPFVTGASLNISGGYELNCGYHDM